MDSGFDELIKIDDFSFNLYFDITYAVYKTFCCMFKFAILTSLSYRQDFIGFTTLKHSFNNFKYSFI